MGPEGKFTSKNAIAGLVVAAGFVSLVICWRKHQERLNASMKRVTISQLWVYPVKSLSGTPVTEVEVVEEGFKYDRDWAVFSKESNNHLTQSTTPVLKLISAFVDEKRNVLVLSADEMATTTQDRRALKESVFELPLRPLSEKDDDTSELTRVEISTMPNVARNEGKEVAQWLSHFVGQEVWLGRCKTNRRPKDHKINSPAATGKEKVKFQAWGSVHLISEEGLKWVRKESGVYSFKTQNVRANIVVSGTEFPEEDTWKTLNCPEKGIRFTFGRWTNRCSFLCLNDDATKNSDGEPIRTLEKHRNAHNRYLLDKSRATLGPMFGSQYFHKGTGILEIGDQIVVEKVQKGPVFQ